MHSKTIPGFRHDSFHGRIGIACADITPPVGIYSRNWGAAKHDVADSIHRPLTLTAMTLSPLAGDYSQVYVDADLGWWKSPQTARQFLARLSEAVSLEPENLIFALSHTHSSPPLMDADDSLPGSELHHSWMEKLFEATVHAITQSQKTQFEGILEWHTGRCRLATNRDLPDPDPERKRIVCGFNPNGETEDTLIVGRITDFMGTVRGTLVNYACHPTTLAWDNTAISPDYIGAMRETIHRETNAPALFMIGVCGELAPRYQYVGDPEIADRHGRQLGYAVLATLCDMEPAGTMLSYRQTVESGAPLAVWKHEQVESSLELSAIQKSVDLPLKNWPSADELENERRVCTDRALEERLRRKRDIRRILGDGSHFKLPVYAWRIGDAVLVGSCCEAYSVLQQELRRRFPDRTIVCMNLINGSLGYLPPAELYDADVYPVWQTPFDRGSMELTLETMTKAIHDVVER